LKTLSYRAGMTSAVIISCTEELNFITQDSRRVPGKVSMVPDNLHKNLEKRSFNFSSISKGASLTKSLFTFLRKYSFRDSSERGTEEGLERGTEKG
jgi:hypothetical protein